MKMINQIYLLNINIKKKYPFSSKNLNNLIGFKKNFLYILFAYAN